jgi:hypothetical protein
MSSTLSKILDFIVSVRGSALFRGEEKKASAVPFLLKTFNTTSCSLL